MSRGSPSMIALLGVLAVAGYQNRDKLSSMLHGAGGTGPNGQHPGAAGMNSASQSSGQTGGGLMDDFRRMVGGSASGGAAAGGLMGGLSEILGRFTNPVQSAKAQSWVDTGPNGSLTAADLDEVLDQDTMTELMQKTGLDRAELLHRLSTVLPEAVDKMTPHGRLPTDEEARGTY